MNDILDFYQQQAAAGLSTIPWLAKLQSTAVTDLHHHGFPTRHDEEWKYSSVHDLLKQAFVPCLLPSAEKDLPSPCARSDVQGLSPDVFAEEFGVLVQNGLISGTDLLAKKLPAGVLVLPLATALISHPELVKPYLASILQQQHGFHFLNTAMIHCGLLIYIPAGVCIEAPITITHVHDQMNQAVYLRHLIIAEADSQVTVIEDYRGFENCCYLTNTITEVFVGAQAHLTHCKMQRESKAAYHLGHLAVRQAAQSQFFTHSLSLGGKWVRSDLSVYLQEEKAYCLMNGIYAPAEGQHVDHHTVVHHAAPNCRSEQDYKGILTGRSRAVFNGKVIVAKGAIHTDAKQQNKNLLLTPNAEIDTKPQLEIFADDVLCSHGATVGQLDEDALFYLATRGIGRQEASRYLIHAFARDNLRFITQRKLADFMSHLLTEQLG